MKTLWTGVCPCSIFREGGITRIITRREREEQELSCLTGKTFLKHFQNVADWGYSSFLGPRLLKGSQIEGRGERKGWLVTRITYIP